MLLLFLLLGQLFLVDVSLNLVVDKVLDGVVCVGIELSTSESDSIETLLVRL